VSSSESACCDEMLVRLAVLLTTLSVSRLRSFVGTCVCVCVFVWPWSVGVTAAGRGRHISIVRNETNRTQ